MGAGSETAQALRRRGVRVVFGSGGFGDGAVQDHLADLPAVATLHEQTATFAAEGWAKVTRSPGVVVLDGEFGLPRALTGVANAFANGSPLVVLDDLSRAHTADAVDRHTAMARTITRAVLRADPGEAGQAVLHACALADTPPRGPVLVTLSPGATSPEEQRRVAAGDPDATAVGRASDLLDHSTRPVIVAGGGVYWAGAERPLRRLAEDAAIPVIMNGMGRGTLPADHELAVSRARPFALREADLVLVAGTPLDFRLSYGQFGAARLVHLCEHDSEVARHAELAGSVIGRLDTTLAALADGRRGASGAEAWAARVRAEELRRRQEEVVQLTDDAVPMRPTRFYGELRKWLDRDAIVIGDGGDFVSYAGRYVDSFVPGCFLDPGPFGCLGVGLGYALAARLAHPRRQIVTLLGDGAAGFSLMELETLARHRLPVVAAVGNNGAWGLEKHHMKAIFGYDAVADLNQDTRYDEVARSLGGHGELIERPSDLAGAFDRAERAGVVAVLNVLLDPADAYPRSTILA